MWSLASSEERDEEVVRLREENALLREASFTFGALAERLSLRLEALRAETRMPSRRKRSGNRASGANRASVTG